jgi:hypothetical protein
MRRLALYTLVLCPTVLLVGSSGCTKQDPPLDDAALAERRRVHAEKLKVVKTPLEPKGRDGFLKGRVVFEGEIPKREVQSLVPLNPDRAVCLKGSSGALYKETWLVNNDNRGVANVVIYLEPPKGKYFTLTAKETNRKDEVVVLDQPCCTFNPHITMLFPAYFDGTKYLRTGQLILVKNSDPVPHSIQWSGSFENELGTHEIPGGKQKELTFNPQRQPFRIGCGNHRWMEGFIWCFEHPYFAITDADGHFELKNLPTEVEVNVSAWHESTEREPFEQRSMTLKQGVNPPLDLRLTAPKSKR